MEMVKDEDGYRYPPRRIGWFAYHDLKCFLAIMDAHGNA
jgi:hypothetical protein